jgi:SlyX protein
MTDKITDLEIRMAFQDDLLDALNKVVAEQAIRVDYLHKQVQQMEQQLRQLSPSQMALPEEETPPPHY